MSTRITFRNIVSAVLFAAACLGITALSASAAGAESLPNTGAPAGFTLTKITDGLVAPTAAQFAPDGRIFVAQKNGVVKLYKNGVLRPQPFYTIPNVNDYVDRGLLGLALDPNFATNGYVYLLYTHDNNPSNIAGPKTGRLVRVTANGDQAVAGSEFVVLGTNVGNSVQTSCNNFVLGSDCLPADGLSHAPGSVRFAPDGKLIVSIGDAAGYDDVDRLAFLAQNLDSTAGKILRINPDGTAPSDNPYYNGSPTANRSKVFAYGVRNAFRLSVRPSDGLIMAGDVGWNTWEEINVVPKGGNLGWPCYEANDQQNGTGAPGIKAYKDEPECQQMYQNPPANLVSPIHYYPHPPSSAVVSGGFYTGNGYPAQYKDMFFYADYAKNQIYAMRLNAANAMVPSSNITFASNAGGPVNFFTGADGDLYYLAINNGGIYRIAYSTQNQGPSANIASDVNYGAAPLTVKFTSSGSSDPENDELNFLWDFGDNSPTSTAANPTHQYAQNGTYTATLTVTDAYNNTSVKTLEIRVGQTAPTLTISSPTDLTSAAPDQVINYAATATDVVDGPIAGANIKWQISIQHCPLDSCHVHNVQTINGGSGTFTYPHHDGPFYVLLSASVTNSSNLTTSKTVSVFPQGQPIIHAMNFDGSNDYAVAAAPQDFRLQQFTVEAMVKALSTDDWGSEVVSMGNNWMLRMRTDGNLFFSFTSGTAWQNLETSNVNVKDGLWHHVAVTRTATAIKLYVDGEIVAQSENTNPIQYIYGGNLIVGRHGDEDDHFNFNGAIDEVRVWSVPRTDAQIKAFNSTSLPADQPNLLAYFTAEEGNGLTVADSSANGAHDLTLVNGANWTAGAPLRSPVTPVTTTPITQLTDTFSGTTIDPAKWGTFGPAAAVSQNDTFRAAPTPNATGYSGIISNGAFELKSNAVYVNVPQVTNAGTTAETQLILVANEANLLSVGKTGGSLLLRNRVNNVNSDTYLPYDAAAMRWWRIQEANNSITFETSPDGTTWTVRRTVAKSFDLTQLKVVLQAGTWQNVAAPGAAVFDNLNVAPAPPAATNTSLALNGTATAQAVLSGGDHMHANYQVFTLEAWVKTAATGVWGGEIVSNGNNYGARITPDGNVRFYIHTGNFVWKDYVTTGLNLKDNAWHHVAISKDATSVKIYVDGTLRQTFASPEAISYTLGKNLVIGRHGDGDANFNFTGNIDELRIWSTVRTATEIAANRTAELAPQAGLAMNWRFNEGTGLAAADVAGTHTLTMTAGATWATGYPRP